MTKSEFMEKLAKELKARGVADAADIEEEYEQHFAFKLADGYSEEEIAAKLGDPAKLAAQFGAESASAGKGGKKATVVTGFVFLDIVTVLGFIALAAFALVLAAAAIGFAAIGVSLITKASLCGVIPAMPYGSAVILGVASLAFSPASAARGTPRSSARACARSAASSRTPLPRRREKPRSRRCRCSRSLPRPARGECAAPPAPR